VLDIGDKINRELRSEGANIVVTSQAASLTGGVGSIAAGAANAANYIPESEVPNVKKIFWGLNVTGILALDRRAGWRARSPGSLVLPSV